MANANGIMTTNVTATWPGRWAMFLLARGISAVPVAALTISHRRRERGARQPTAGWVLALKCAGCAVPPPEQTLPNAIGPDSRAIANTSAYNYDKPSSLFRDTASEEANLILTLTGLW